MRGCSLGWNVPRISRFTWRPYVSHTLSAACGQAPPRPTVTEQPPITTVPSSPSPSPTPGAVSGNWVGTFDTSDHDSDCYTNTPPSARFTRDDDRVHGTLSAVNACGLEKVAFDGVLDAGKSTRRSQRRGILRRGHWNALGRCA
jgi:hypothetical protein